MDLQEFKIQVFPLKNKLFRLASRLLEDSEEAKDIVQEAFIKLWNRREKLDEYRSVEAFAMIITRNLCLDKIKAKKYPVDRLENIKADMPGNDTESKLEYVELADHIKEIINKLPEQMKTIMQLRDIEGYELKEIAAIVGMNENAIRVSLSRARKKVREELINNKLYEFKRN
jgi:RNA polymerase sigma-70 factor, ECF subfamily